MTGLDATYKQCIPNFEESKCRIFRYYISQSVKNQLENLKLLIKRWFDTFVTRIIDSILLEVLIGETWSYARLQVIMVRYKKFLIG